MKEIYIVGQNVFTVQPHSGCTAWEALKPRYSPFEVTCTDARPMLEIDIEVAPLPEHDAEMIYEPVHSEVSILSSRASRLPDGSLIIEFADVYTAQPRLLMKMPPEFNKADIAIAPDGDENDLYFLTHAIMIAYMLAGLRTGTLLIHASTVLYEGRAFLFQGKSGTGKSTHASLWTGHITGAELLNDDHPVIRFDTNGTAMAYGSPWSGKTDCYRNVNAAIGAFVRIVRAQENALLPLSPLRAYASLTASVFFLPFLSDELRETRHKTIERLATAVPCREMHCRPDADAALTCKRGLSSCSD